MIHHTSSYTADTRGATKIFASLLAVSLALLTLIAGLASPASTQEQGLPTAADKKVGPIDPANGFPFWYQDSDGLRLELCQVEAFCLLELPSPGQPVTFPDNFGAEQFWWSAEASIDRADGGRALLVLAEEAAFANEDPKDGDQASFGRIRVRLDQLDPGTTYKVTHPYGTENLVAEDDGSIFVSEDIGCALPTPANPCSENNRFAQSLNSRIAGPFLTWDTFGQAPDAGGPPEGFVGDPNVEHAVKGSPVADAGHPSGFQNYFKVEELDDDGNVVGLVGETDQFAVSGKLASPQASADLRSGTYNTTRSVNIVSASDPDDESPFEIYYTTATTEPDAGGNIADPEAPEPTVGDPSQLYTGAISIGAEDAVNKVNLKFVVVDDEGDQSPVEEETYTIDTIAPTVTAEPGAGVQDAPLVDDPATEEPEGVVLTANKENATIHYTTDGSDPKTSDTQKEYTAPIDVARSQTIKAYAVTTDSAGNDLAGEVETFVYTIPTLAKTGPLNPMGGFPFWYQDYNGTKLELCLDPDDQMCLQPFEMPDATQPVSFPDNFPGEAFWWAADASMSATGGADALLVLAEEAAFANEEPKEGDQMSFGRIRIRVDGLQDATYTVTHPYGTDTFQAEPDGRGGFEINVTEDIGCFPAPGDPCNFDDTRHGRVGPFLTWDTFGQAPDAGGPPAGYVGDPNVEHEVTGSPIRDADDQPQNYFKVEGPNAGGPNSDVLQTRLFTVSGKVSEFTVSASHATGFYNNETTPLEVTLGASEEGATIYYTTGGGDPTTSSEVYDGPITIDQTTELRYMAVDAAGNQSETFTRTYTIDNDDPTVEADPRGGTFENSAPPITLTASEPGRIFYTTNGSNPANPANRSRVLFDQASPIDINTTTTLRFVAIDRAGNQSPVSTETYTITDLTPPVVPTLDLAAASDTGTSTTDNVTRNATLAFSGTTEPGTTVQFLDGANVLGSVTTGQNGQFSFTTGQLAQGVHEITARATDAAGNSSVSDVLRVTIDTTAPDTTITSGPSGTVNATTAAFGFASSEPQDATFRCRLDAAAFAACTSPTNLTGLAPNRAHTFRAQATDVAGNVDATPATRTWTIDTVRPTISTVTPANGARRIAAGTNVTATFSEAVTNVDGTTVRLVRNSNGNRVAATVTYNAGTRRVTLNPNANLVRGATYTATIVGGANGVKDEAGNALAANRTWSFTIIP